ncbi:hypothetical protein ACE01N_04910 [Saccharicrinis sp. FJH2]|uniref:hypothetical protein n=1 Tax=unclassified Saccharicrinis TaxID=2646859 RepID=UPI0035D493C5
MSYTMEWCDSNVYVTFGASVEGKEIIKIDDIIYGDSRLENMHFQLFDFSKTCDINMHAADMKIIGILDKKASHWNNHVKVAIVSVNKQLEDLVDDYVRIMADTNWQVKMFTTRNEALKWCNE